MAGITKLHSYKCSVSQQIALRVHASSDVAGGWPLCGSCCVASASCEGVSTVNHFGGPQNHANDVLTCSFPAVCLCSCNMVMSDLGCTLDAASICSAWQQCSFDHRSPAAGILFEVLYEDVTIPWGLIGIQFICSFCRDMACSVAGITSDANVLTNELRLIAQR